jgi:hypothetical protein
VPRSKLGALLETVQDCAGLLAVALALGPPAVCAVHDAGLLLLLVALNSTFMPLFPGRQRAPFMEELLQPQQVASYLSIVFGGH